MNKKNHSKAVFMALCGAPIPINGNHNPINPKESSIIPVGVSVGKSYENDESIGDNNQQKIPPVFNPKEFKGALEIKRLNDHQSDEELEGGVHYRVLAYKQMGNDLIFNKSEDFVIGGEKKLELDKNQKYTLIIYSFGSTSEIPEPKNTKNIDKVRTQGGLHACRRRGKLETKTKTTTYRYKSNTRCFRLLRWRC